MNYQEGSTYKLQSDYYESIKLTCTFVEGVIVWFQNISSSGGTVSKADYKLNKKTNKLYIWNDKVCSWDTVGNTLSDYSADDIWIKRTGYVDGYYNGNIGQD